ncbi:MAG: hypothetical protein ACLFQT_01225 [Thiohalophilus sp.]
MIVTAGNKSGLPENPLGRKAAKSDKSGCVELLHSDPEEGKPAGECR